MCDHKPGEESIADGDFRRGKYNRIFLHSLEDRPSSDDDTRISENRMECHHLDLEDILLLHHLNFSGHQSGSDYLAIVPLQCIFRVRRPHILDKKKIKNTLKDYLIIEIFH